MQVCGTTVLEHLFDLVRGYMLRGPAFTPAAVRQPGARPPQAALKTSKTQRLLQSFAAVKLQPEHRNYGNEGPALRDFGVAPSVATALIRWGAQHDLVCRFETVGGRSNNAYSWQPAFLRAAVQKHLELFGEAGQADLPERLLNYRG